MSILDETNVELEPNPTQQDEYYLDESIEQLRDEVDHLRSCLEQLIDIIDNQTDVSAELLLLNDRMSLFERRVQRTEDGVADLSWVFRRRASDS